MEDGAPMHRSVLSSAWRHAHGMKKLQWPANSLDLNPIKNLWKILKDVVQKESLPRNRDELVETLQRVWEEVSLQIINMLIASMSFRMEAVINAHGVYHILGGRHNTIKALLLWNCVLSFCKFNIP